MPGLINAHTHAYSALRPGPGSERAGHHLHRRAGEACGGSSTGCWRRRTSSSTRPRPSWSRSGAASPRSSTTTPARTPFPGRSRPRRRPPVSWAFARASATRPRDRDGADILAQQIEENVSFMKEANAGDSGPDPRTVRHPRLLHGLPGDAGAVRGRGQGRGVPGGFHVHIAEGPEDEPHCEASDAQAHRRAVQRRRHARARVDRSCTACTSTRRRWTSSRRPTPRWSPTRTPIWATRSGSPRSPS